MGSVWKVILSFAVILMITGVGIMITGVNADVAAAGDYMEELSTLIRESGYNKEIVRQCEEEAEKNGYFLEVQVFREESTAGLKYAKIRLRYPYRLPVFQTMVWKAKERII